MRRDRLDAAAQAPTAAQFEGPQFEAIALDVLARAVAYDAGFTGSSRCLDGCARPAAGGAFAFNVVGTLDGSGAFGAAQHRRRPVTGIARLAALFGLGQRGLQWGEYGPTLSNFPSPSLSVDR